MWGQVAEARRVWGCGGAGFYAFYCEKLLVARNWDWGQQL